MRKEIADYVLPVFRSAIEYKEGLRTNENVWKFRFQECQKKMLALLQAPIRDDLRNDVLGDPRQYEGVGSRGGFLGIRYALACWLDEIFILDSAWRDQWNVNSMESTLFKSRERATEFWAQAQRAQTRPTWDALEVYYLCVMLGFRGEMIEKPAELAAWRDGIQSQITQAEGRIYTAPAGLTVQPDVHRPLTGAAKMQKWSMFVVVLVLAFIPLLIFVFAR
jgi:type IV/VI secretion system ImpK/VasF family protein